MNVNSIKNNLISIENDIKKIQPECILLCVTKTRTIDEILCTYDLGYRNFGENKVNELIEKKNILPKDINWHMIGHLQTNKVKKIVGEVSLIHSLDSKRLLLEIDKEAFKKNIIQDCLIEINLSNEKNKTGLLLKDLDDLIDSIIKCKHVCIKGIMTMAENTEDIKKIRKVFVDAKKIFEKLSNLSYNNIQMTYLSMGMTNDYNIALEEGSNIIRIGSKIYGNREGR